MPLLKEFKGNKPSVSNNVYLAEGVCLIGDVKIDEDSSVFFNAVLRADLAPIKIGCRTNIQDNVTLHVSTNTPIIIGNEVTVGHNAVLHGCVIEDNVLIGMNAVIMDGVHIKKNCIVGAGSLVTQGREFPEGSLIVGSPAHVARELTEEEIRSVKLGIEHYIDIKNELIKNA